MDKVRYLATSCASALAACQCPMHTRAHGPARPHTDLHAYAPHQLCASQKTVELRRSCDGTKGLMQMGTGMMGCSSFQSSQEDACECRRDDGTLAPSQYALDQQEEARAAAAGDGGRGLPGSANAHRRKRRKRKRRKRHTEL